MRYKERLVVYGSYWQRYKRYGRISFVLAARQPPVCRIDMKQGYRWAFARDVLVEWQDGVLEAVTASKNPSVW